MNDLQSYIEKKLFDIISTWDEDSIYAISFLVQSNEAYEYKGCSNVTEFCVSYNTENDCGNAEELSEKRWNYAFWRQNETVIIEAADDDEGMKLLFEWYGKKGIYNVGYEDYEKCYDERMRYIGKGPVGYNELLVEIVAIARKMQESGFIEAKFSKKIPIIIHDLSYSWYTVDATREVNPNGEADLFFLAMRKNGLIQ